MKPETSMFERAMYFPAFFVLVEDCAKVHSNLIQRLSIALNEKHPRNIRYADDTALFETTILR